jgi:ketosteroid isomerase-like protein
LHRHPQGPAFGRVEFSEFLCENSADFQELFMIHRTTIKRPVVIFLGVCALTFSAAAQTRTSAMKGSLPATPDKAFLQKVWDGWGTLNPDHVAGYYAAGPHAFFDIAPLKYASWDEYQKGVKLELGDYKSAKFTLNDDTAIHAQGESAWVTATVAFEMTHKSGKVDMGNLRWTAILENQDGKWMIVHEHVSVPMQ